MKKIINKKNASSVSKGLSLIIASAVFLGLGTSQALAFSQKSAQCSMCHSAQYIGKQNAPKKLVLPDSDSTVSPKNHLNTVTSVKTAQAPVLDGKSNDAAWTKAPAVQVKTTWLSPKAPKETTGATPTVTLKSLYTDKNLYILASWADSNPDVQKDSWSFDGTKWTQDKAKYDEDRVAFMWNNNVAGFDRVGCAISCHGYTKDYGKYNNNSGETADLWHWKSTRTLPLNWTDDGSVQHVVYDKIGVDKGRKSDVGTTGEAKNEQTVTVDGASVKLPKYMFDPAKAVKTILDKNVLFASNAQAFDQAKFNKGDLLPGYVINDENTLDIKAGPSGSRGDVQTFAQWKDGYWTLEISRALDTKNTDDTVFEVGKTKAFGMSVFNNNTDYNHAVSNVLFLDLAISQTVKPAPVIKTPIVKAPVTKAPVTKTAVIKELTGTVIAKGLNVRQGAGVKYKKIGLLKKGAKIVAIGKTGNWVKLKLSNGTSGYVSASYVKLK